MIHPIPPAALAQHIACLGKTGSGKTSTAKLAIEQVVAEGARVCVLDTLKSDWWGITSSASGKRPGLPFKILGGPRGHVPLHPSSGKAIGELVGRGALPLSIIDMADFDPGDPQRFFVDFAKALFRTIRGVLYLVIEEAHEIAPKERAGFGSENMALHWAKKIATSARSKGIRLVVVTQRTQALHNALLGSCDTLIAHRITLPADQVPIRDWLKANVGKEIAETVMGSLASQPTGTGWICSGEAQIHEQRKFPKISTFDNSATPTGDASDIDVATAPVDLDELRAIIGDAVKQAEASDPRALRRQIEELERRANKPEPDPELLAHDLAMAEKKGADAIRSAMAGHLSTIVNRWSEFTASVSALTDAITSAQRGIDIAMQYRAEPRAPAAVPNKPPRSASASWTTPVDQMDGYSDPQRRIVSSLSFWHRLDHPAPTREQVAAVAGYSPTSGNFANLLGALKTGNVIHYPTTGTVALKVNRIGAMSREDAVRMLDKILSAPQRKIIDALASHPDILTREQIASRTDYSPTSGNFANLLGSLRTIDVIDYPSKGTVALSKWARELLH